MKFLVVLAALVAVAACWSVPSEEELANHWQTFKAAHAKNYPSAAEEAHRMGIFKENAIKVAKHNARFDAGAVSFKVAVNKYSDLLTHEVNEMLSGFRPSMNVRGARPVHIVSEPMGPLAWPWPWPSRNDTVDWSKKGYVTPVKEQGTSCGNSWAFSATGALEAALYNKTGKLVSLSEQNLMDCARQPTYHNAGCHGGNMVSAFQYVIDNGGIDTEASYPYKAEDSTNCQFSKDNVGGSMSSYVIIDSESEAALQDAVTSVGPVSVGIDADHWSFRHYKSGIFHEKKCSPYKLGHAALVVGYGSAGKKDYWIVKNSWGTHWGEKGYVRIARNKDNHCGIATSASYPVV